MNPHAHDSSESEDYFGDPGLSDVKQAPRPPEGHYFAGGKTVPIPFLDTTHEAVRILLRHMGVDPTTAALAETPQRVARALIEMTAGYRDDPQLILSKTFEDDCDEVIILRNIPFTSMCEHHLLPFSGSADVGYLPGKVVGLSKLARLVDCFARRLQMQERMTRQIADALVEHLQARGAGCIVRANHSCMACRGVKKAGAEMVTSRMLGVFRDKAEARAEFLMLCQR
jgi:GTP cyclohydrolase I